MNRGHESEKSCRNPPKKTLDRVLFFGGEDLTAFQSYGLICFGLAIILFVVVPLVVYEVLSAPELQVPLLSSLWRWHYGRR
jgi:hypothetical protein